MLYYNILHYAILYYTAQCYTMLYFTMQYYTALWYTILYYTMLYFIIQTLYFHGHDVIPAPEVEEPFTGELSFLNEAREEFKKTSGPYEHLQDDPKV